MGNASRFGSASGFGSGSRPVPMFLKEGGTIGKIYSLGSASRFGRASRFGSASRFRSGSRSLLFLKNILVGKR